MQEITLKLKKLKVNNLTQRKISVLGGTGSGKTTTLKCFALKSPVDTYIFDVLDVIYIKGFQRITINKKMIDKGTESAKLMNKLKGKFIFAFKGLLQNELVLFCNDFFKEWKPQNCFIMIDEIHEYTPEAATSGQYCAELERAIRHWRNNNIGFFMDSQRPALVNKRVLALTDFLIIFRLTWTNDVKAAKELIQNMTTKEECNKILKTLQTEKFMNGYAIDFRG